MGIGISYHMWFLFIPAFECIFCFDQLKIRSYLRAETRIQRILWIICTPAIFFPQWCLQIKVLYKFLICEKWTPLKVLDNTKLILNWSPTYSTNQEMLEHFFMSAQYSYAEESKTLSSIAVFSVAKFFPLNWNCLHDFLIVQPTNQKKSLNYITV